MRHSVSFFDTIALWSMLALCALLPFFWVPLSFITIPQSKMLLIPVLLIVAGVSWCIARYTTGTARITKSSVVAAALLLPIAYAISTLVSGFNVFSLVGTGVEQDTLVASVLAFAALALAVLIFAEMPKSSLTAVRAFSVGALALVFIQLLHLLIPSLTLSAALAGQTGNLVGNWHELGLLVGLFAYLGLALFDTPLGDGAWRFVFLALSGLSFLLLIVVELPDVWGALAVLALVSLARQWYNRRPREPWFRRYGLWLSVAVVSAFFGLFGSIVWNVLPSSLQIASVEIRPSWQGTFTIGKQALNNPGALVFGVGPNTFMREWSLYKPASVNQTQFWNTDFNAGIGSIPTSLITVGIVGLLAWLVFIGAFLWMFISCVMRGVRDPALPTLFAVGMACLYLIAFHVLYVPQAGLNVITFIFIGMYVALVAEAGHIRIMQIRLRPSRGGWVGYAQIGAGALGGVLLLVAGLFVLRVNLAEILVNRSILLYSSSQDVGDAVALIQDALFIYPNDDRAHRAAVELGILELQNLAASSDPTSETARAQLQAILQDTIQHGLAAVSINSGDYQNWLEVASLYQNLAGGGMQGAYDNARQAYERALAAKPKDPMLYFRLAQLDVLEKKPDAALADIKSALDLKPDFAAVYYLASQIYTSKNDLASASTAAGLAVKYAPDDKLGWYSAGIIAYAQGNWQSAVADEKHALALDSQYANALYVLGLSYYQLQQPVDSLATFQALGKLDPSDTSVQQILSNLEAGLPPLPASSAPAATSTPVKSIK